MRYSELTELGMVAAPDSRQCVLPRAMAKLTDPLGWGMAWGRQTETLQSSFCC